VSKLYQGYSVEHRSQNCQAGVGYFWIEMVIINPLLGITWKVLL
jgi:hypothetical protein